MLSKEDEKKYLKQMQDGMYLALEAAHYLGGRMEIEYIPKQEAPTPKPIQAITELNHRLDKAEQAIEAFKDMLNGMTVKQLAEKYGVKTIHVPELYHPVEYAIHRELQKKCYEKASFQPYRIDPVHGRMYRFGVHAVRPHKEFLLNLIQRINKKRFLDYILIYIR